MIELHEEVNQLNACLVRSRTSEDIDRIHMKVMEIERLEREKRHESYAKPSVTTNMIAAGVAITHTGAVDIAVVNDNWRQRIQARELERQKVLNETATMISQWYRGY